MLLTIAHDFLPKRPTVNTSLVMDHFGVGFETGQHVIVADLELPIEPDDIVCFTGPSGSGKSSLLRAAAEALAGNARRAEGRERRGEGPDCVALASCPSPLVPPPSPCVLNIDELELPDVSLVDALGLPAEETLRLLSLCGLGEARLMLRNPRELSDGQRFRFRFALALAQQPAWIVADEFTATLDRTLAKVVAFNIHRLRERGWQGLSNAKALRAARSGPSLRSDPATHSPGFLLATTHTDILDDLRPTLHVQCRLDGHIDITRDYDRRAGWRQPPEVFPTEREEAKPRLLVSVGDDKRKDISFANELHVTIGTKADWPRFALWHYRSHRLGIVRFVTLLKHGDEPIGICVFTAPPLALAQRKQFFGLSGKWSRVKFQSLNRQLVNLSRVVLHPTYRGAGIAAPFIRASCEMCPFPWIESLAQMGGLNPFFEKAGFVRVGTSPRRKQTRQQHSALYGTRSKHGRKPIVTQETHNKSRYADPVYFVFDNRRRRAEGGGARAEG